MKRSTIIVLVIVGILALWVYTSFNGLVKVDEKVSKVWNNVETQYQRRIDLIPNLVETVKALADKEKGTFTEIAGLRSGVKDAQKTLENPNANQEEKVAAYQKMDAARSFIMNIQVENYPNLQFPESFRKLQDELAGTENRIATSRTDYNEVIQEYNTKVRAFPANIMAGIFNFDKKTGFKAQAGAENAPKVQF